MNRFRIIHGVVYYYRDRDDKWIIIPKWIYEQVKELHDRKYPTYQIVLQPL